MLAAVALTLLGQGCTNSYAAGRHLVELGDRQFLLSVPSSLPVGVRVPLVVDFHGFSESPYYQDELVGMTEMVEKYKWLAVIPFGTATQNRKGKGGCCAPSVSEEDCEKGSALDRVTPCSFNAGACCGVASSRNTDDIKFTEDLLDWAMANMCADSRYVFATGFSNGGMMSNRVGCDLSHRFRSIAPVAGNIRENSRFTCNPTDPVAWVSVCGDRDSACNSDFEQTAIRWKTWNKCTTGPTPTFVSATTKCAEYTGCKDGAFVEYCEVTGLTHEWSGRPRPDGTSPSQSPANVDATTYIFDKWSALVSAEAGRLSNRTA